MKRVLILEEESKFTNLLSSTLTNDGFVVAVAKNPVNAIDVATHFLPDIFVTSDTSEDQPASLQVSEALRTISPDVKTIVIGPSSNSKSHLGRRNTYKFVGKPVSMAYLRHVVHSTSEVSPSDYELQPLPVGVIEVTSDGQIGYANAFAKRLFRQALGDSELSSLCDVFSLGTVTTIIEENGIWHAVSPRTNPAITWHVAYRKFEKSDGGLLVILQKRDKSRQFHPVVRTLLCNDEDDLKPWSFTGHALIIEPRDTDRDYARAQLEAVGCFAHVSANITQGLGLLRSDPLIQLVIIGDEALPSEERQNVLEKFRAARPDALIVVAASSGTNQGATSPSHLQLLKKPWDSEALRSLLLH